MTEETRQSGAQNTGARKSMTSSSRAQDNNNEIVDVTSRDVESRRSRRDAYENEIQVKGLSDDEEEQEGEERKADVKHPD